MQIGTFLQVTIPWYKILEKRNRKTQVRMNPGKKGVDQYDIMQYDSTPYIGMAAKKMAAPLYVYKVICSKLCPRFSHKLLLTIRAVGTGPGRTTFWSFKIFFLLNYGITSYNQPYIHICASKCQ